MKHFRKGDGERSGLFTRRALLLAALAALLARGLRAEDENDTALEAVRRGEIRPLHEILALPEVQSAGEVIEVEIEREDGGWTYEVEVVATDGTLRKLRIDAASGQVRAGDED